VAPLPRTSPRSRRSPRAEEPDGPSGPGAEDFVWEQIGKVALLNAEEKAQLAKRVEAGLYAAERVRRAEDVTDKLSPQLRRDLRSIVCGGHCATNHLLEANCGWSCRWPSATPAAAA
jgi:Sigma-70 factor, region 1.2